MNKGADSLPEFRAAGSPSDALTGALLIPLRMIRTCGLRVDDPIVDVTGESSLTEALLDAGYTDLTMVVRSASDLGPLRIRARQLAARLDVVEARVPLFHLHRRFALWHDGGSFHLLTYPEDRQQYIEVMQEALRPDGRALITTHGPEGPRQWQGVPVRCYSAVTLPSELGPQFELAEQALQTHREASGEHRQLLHCLFRRRPLQ
jgi:SAM-dependent methyltransferase